MLCFVCRVNPRITRRQALGGLLGVAVLTAGCHRPAPAPSPTESFLDLSDVENRHNARIGLFAVDLTSGAELRNRADHRFAMCSTFKTYAAGRVLQLAERGRRDLDAPTAVTAADIVANSPVTEQHVGGTMTLAQLCDAALTHSDNTAGNLLLRAIGGPSEVTAFARSIGDQQTRLDRWETELNSAVPGDERDTTTPSALGHGYRQLLVGSALSAGNRRRLESWMKANVTSAKRFRAAVPPGWTTADKTGAGDYGSTNDAGLLLGPSGQSLLVVVLTRSRDDQPDAPALNEAIVDTAGIVLRKFGYR